MKAIRHGLDQRAEESAERGVEAGEIVEATRVEQRQIVVAGEERLRSDGDGERIEGRAGLDPGAQVAGKLTAAAAAKAMATRSIRARRGSVARARGEPTR